MILSKDQETLAEEYIFPIDQQQLSSMPSQIKGVPPFKWAGTRDSPTAEIPDLGSHCPGFLLPARRQPGNQEHMKMQVSDQRSQEDLSVARPDENNLRCRQSSSNFNSGTRI